MANHLKKTTTHKRIAILLRFVFYTIAIVCDRLALSTFYFFSRKIAEDNLICTVAVFSLSLFLTHSWSLCLIVICLRCIYGKWKSSEYLHNVYQ